jgi:DNA (cytosine-5)-methyltransferase 1
VRLLDLFCGAGGAAVGYHRAGFDEIVGVDIKPQPRYPFRFVLADALDFCNSFGIGFDAIHASPPCQGYVQSGMMSKTRNYPKLVPDVRTALIATGRLWVIENVPGAPVKPTFTLCGSMFGLGVKRHRHFEAPGVFGLHPAPCDHSKPITGVYGHCHGKGGAWKNVNQPMLPSSKEVWAREMGIDWMTASELTQSIPPAYTEFIGKQLLAAVGQR